MNITIYNTDNHNLFQLILEKKKMIGQKSHYQRQKCRGIEHLGTSNSVTMKTPLRRSLQQSMLFKKKEEI